MNTPLPHRISLEDFLKWEERQSERYEWLDGSVIRCAGGSDDHAAIISNIHAILRHAVTGGPCFVRGSDRKLVPRDEQGQNLGSFYADLFVSCSSGDRKGNAAHFPRAVIEVLSEHGGSEFTKKKHAYLASRELQEYLIIDSTQRYGVRYAWTSDRRLAITEYYRGPLHIAAIGLELPFDDVYAETDVPGILRPVYPEHEVILE